jgi:hypothetical protein
MGWFGTILRTVSTVSGALSQLDSDGEANADLGFITPIGDIEFKRDEHGLVSAVNNSTSYDYFLYFSLVKKDGELSNDSVFVKRNKGLADVTLQLKTYKDGVTTVAPLANGDGQGTLVALTAQYVIKSPTTFSTRAKPGDQKVDYHMYVDEDTSKGVYQLRFNSREPFHSMEVQFTDRAGITYYLKNEQARPAGKKNYISSVDLPKGCNHNLPLQDVKLQVHLTKASTLKQFPDWECPTVVGDA